LSGDGFRLETLVDARDFVRLLVEDGLKVDMVNDRTSRIGRTVPGPGGIMLDNIDNIAANKICAVLGRDDPKDVFDLYVLFREHSLDWKAAVRAASGKCVVDSETLEFRLRSFPAGLLDSLAGVDPVYLEELRRDYGDMVRVVMSGV
jgi:hypothetical protein